MPHAKIKLQGAQAISLTALLTGSFRDTVLRHGFIYLFIYLFCRFAKSYLYGI